MRYLGTDLSVLERQSTISTEKFPKMAVDKTNQTEILNQAQPIISSQGLRASALGKQDTNLKYHPMLKKIHEEQP